MIPSPEVFTGLLVNLDYLKIQINILGYGEGLKELRYVMKNAAQITPLNKIIYDYSNRKQFQAFASVCIPIHSDTIYTGLCVPSLSYVDNMSIFVLYINTHNLGTVFLSLLVTGHSTDALRVYLCV